MDTAAAAASVNDTTSIKDMNPGPSSDPGQSKRTNLQYTLTPTIAFFFSPTHARMRSIAHKQN